MNIQVLVAYATKAGSTGEVAEVVARVHKAARRFLHTHHEQLAERPLAVFAMGPKTVADDEVAASRAQLDRALDPEIGVLTPVPA